MKAALLGSLIAATSFAPVPRCLLVTWPPRNPFAICRVSKRLVFR